MVSPFRLVEKNGGRGRGGLKSATKGLPDSRGKGGISTMRFETVYFTSEQLGLLLAQDLVLRKKNECDGIFGSELSVSEKGSVSRPRKSFSSSSKIYRTWGGGGRLEKRKGLGEKGLKEKKKKRGLLLSEKRGRDSRCLGKARIYL